MTDERKRNVVYLDKEKSIAVIEDKNYYMVVNRISISDNGLIYDIVEYFAPSLKQAMNVVNKINEEWIFDYY